MRTLKHAKIAQLIGQANARAVVDQQYFQQRSRERLAASFDVEECEANAPRFPHAYEHMNGAVRK